MSPKPTQRLTCSSSDLFGKEDPEFLADLAKIYLPVQKPPSISKLEQPSSSSDLFTEDPAFLDELSNTAFLGGMEHSSDPSNRTLNTGQSLNLKVRKRSHSPDQDDGSTYTDSDVYGPSKFHGYGEYMYRKRAKLNIQNDDLEESSGGKKSNLFQGLALYINGKTNPSVQELRKLIIQYGGIFHPYLDRKRMVTHIIASNLTPSKVIEFKHMKVVTPAWLLESIKVGKLLSWRDYLIGADSRLDQSQGRPMKSLDGASSQKLSTRIPNEISQAGTARVGADPDHDRELTAPTTNLSPSKVSSSNPPPYATDPSTAEPAACVPSYAPSGSNPHAKLKMEDPEWRAANTAVAPGFIEGYYKNSRLHHLSTWKTELQNLVAKAIERVENGHAHEDSVEGFGLGGTSIHGVRFQKQMSPRKGKEKSASSQVIMHCDFDSFFVSAGIVDRPNLKGKPVVVCHSQGGQGGAVSTSEIASSSYDARKFGVKNGMSLGQAKKLCPDIHTIPYEFERYKRLSLQFYTILMSYADDIQAVSVDEALVDVTSTIENARSTASVEDTSNPHPDFAKNLAGIIRARVKHATGCEISIGISHNILLARIATRRAKPAGIYHIQLEDVSDILSPLDIENLWGFGWSTRNKVKAKFGVTSLGELAKQPKAALCDALGKKTGETLWKAIRGIDDTKIESDHVRKSVSSEINYGIRFNEAEDAEMFVRNMAVEVSKRLNDIGMSGRSLTLKIMTRDPTAPVEAPKFLGHGICDTTSKTSTLIGPGGRATADAEIIGECAWHLLKGMHFDPKELRGIGIHVQKLERMFGVGTAQDLPIAGGQSVLSFKKIETAASQSRHDPGGEKPSHPTVTVEPPSQDIAEGTPSSFHGAYLNVDGPQAGLPSISQVDPSFLEALPANIRTEIEREYTRPGSGQAIAGPSRYKSPGVQQIDVNNSASKRKKHSTIAPADLARITQQFAPKSRPSISPSKRMHPLFAKRKAPVTLQVSIAELKLLDIDPDVWAALPVELQREQLAALRAANVGTGMAIRASMSSQAKQERILSLWRAMRQRSPSVGVRGRRPEITAKILELPGLKQRGKSKSGELKVSDTDDIQVVIAQWVRGFEDDGPRLGDIEYFGKFLERCVETDTGTEKAISALKWWRILLRQRWADMEMTSEGVETDVEPEIRKAGRDWWHAFWQVKARMDRVVRTRFGGRLSLK